ncbi:MAG: CRISPR-associated RAMP protein, Cmr4 family [Desulfonauticus sp. 38_4375]|nr:MAG: CRISPR-associated RAMP protein, Cmr4 family [Desulfonauticus sp. 38_4375]
MLKKEYFSILSFYAISPIHAGSGASVATVDLPIQRERHTGYPIIQASGVKGAMRDHFRNFFEDNKDNKNVKEVINYIFGSDKQDDWSEKESLPGAISLSDAKLLAFPVRSNVAPFVWVTCPTVLERFKRDLEYLGIKKNLTYDSVSKNKAITLKGAETFKGNYDVLLEEALVKIDNNTEENKDELVEFICENFLEIKTLLLISDEMFDYCVTCCTEIQTNIKINAEKGTAEDGSPRYQEFLPADSFLYSLVCFSAQSKDKNSFAAKTIKDYIQSNIKDFLQIGGDVTLGKGICNIKWIDADKEQE